MSLRMRVRHDRQDGDPQLGYAEEELVAESVAHISVAFVGLDCSASAVPYLACWAQSAPAGTFERIAALVDRLARRLEDTLGADSDRPARRRHRPPRRRRPRRHDRAARLTSRPQP
jgi:hypothetical protein